MLDQSTYISYAMEGLLTTWVLNDFDADRDLQGISFWDPDTLMETKATEIILDTVSR